MNMNNFAKQAKTHSALPKSFVVSSPWSQKIAGIVRILLGMFLLYFSILLIYDITWKANIDGYALLMAVLMLCCSVYVIREGILFDIGRTITVEGKNLKVGNSSCSLDCINRVKRMESEDKNSLFSRKSSRFSSPCYTIYDCWGMPVCYCRENYHNFSLLHSWLLQKPSETE